MSDFITRYVWFDKTGKIIEHITDIQFRRSDENIPYVVLVGEQQYVEHLVARLKDEDV